MQMKERNGKNPVPFSITFYTADKSRNKGGEKIQLKSAIRTGLQRVMNKKKYVGVSVPNNTHHPYSVHLYLITEFNGKKVII